MLRKFSRLFFNYNNTALIVCDFQTRVVRNLYRREQTVQNVQTVLDAFLIQNSPDSNKSGKSAAHLQNPIIQVEFLPNKLGATVESVDKKIAQYENHLKIEKRTYSIYSHYLDKFLQSQNVGNILIVGVQTEWCVEQTARHFAQQNYNVKVLTDACGSVNKDQHKNGLRKLAQSDKRIELDTTHGYIVSQLRDYDQPLSKFYVDKQKRDRRH